MNRRSFLTRSGLALGALIVGDEALEAMARLTHVRKTFPSAAVAGVTEHRWVVTGISYSGGVGTITQAHLEVESQDGVRSGSLFLPKQRGVVTLDAGGFGRYAIKVGDHLSIVTEAP